MAVTSNVSPFTSVTASPVEPFDTDDLPIELKIPLPLSSDSSDQDEEKEKQAEDISQKSTEIPMVSQDDTDPPTKDQMLEAPMDTISEGVEPEKLLETIPITLEELADLVETDVYQRDRVLSAEAKMKQLSLSCGLDRRLIYTFSIAYGDMIDQYKTDDQAGFAGLYEACEQLKASMSMKDHTNEALDLDIEGGHTQANFTHSRAGLEMLPPKDQSNVLAFLSRIRTDPCFLSGLISSLSSSELMALTSSYHPAGIDLSILQNHSHGKSQLFSRESQMMKLSRRMDNLRRFHNQDAFFALLYGVFDSSARPGSREYDSRLEIWSAVLAQNMLEGFSSSRPGSDEFAIATLDAFAGFQDWALKPKLESYLMKIITQGSFLLESWPNQPANFTEPMEIYNAKAAVAEADFFESALIDLFDLLIAEDAQRVVPASVLTYAHAVLRHFEDPNLRTRAQQFIVIRWYFATFISSIIVYPEVRGIMMTQHIGETVRGSILQKLVVKMQERVFDVILPWNHHALVNPRLRSKIMAISQCFAPPPLHVHHRSPSTNSNTSLKASSRFLMLTPLDIIGLIQALYPDRTAPQGLTDMAYMDQLSNRPSTAGSSTLVAGSSDVDSTCTLPTVQAAAENPKSIDTSASEQPVKEEHLDVASKSKPRVEANLKSIEQTELDFDLGSIYKSLKSISLPNRYPSPGFSLNAWTLIYYSTDGSGLSMKPIGIDPSSGSMECLSMPQDALYAAASPVSLSDLKVTIVKLLQEEFRSTFGLMEIPTAIAGRSSATPDHLETQFEKTMNRAHNRLDFGSAHQWWRSLQAYQEYLDSTTSKSSSNLLQDIQKDLRQAIDTSSRILKDCEDHCYSLARIQKSNATILGKMEDLRSALRLKMWYISDVRHSATYEEALHVTRALRIMVGSKKAKQPGGVSHWARQRLRGSNIHNRAEAQVLEAIVAGKDHGGLSKMADDQVELTSGWLTRKSIENFCKGEERIHRFCFEIQRSVGKIAGRSMLESPVLWSSSLFKRERSAFDIQKPRASTINSPLSPSFAPPAPYDSSRLRSTAFAAESQSRAGPRPTVRTPTPTKMYGGFFNTSQPLHQPLGLGLYGNQTVLPPSPISPPISWSNVPSGPGSPLHSVPPPPSSISGFGGVHSRGPSDGDYSPAKEVFAERIKKTLYCLLISDLGYLLWNQGSETDTWVNEHLANEGQKKDIDFSEASMEALPAWNEAKPAKGDSHQDSAFSDTLPTASSLHKAVRIQDRLSQVKKVENPFPFSNSYAALLQKMSLTPDPYSKLDSLYELERLIANSIPAPYFQMIPESDSSRPSHPRLSPEFGNKSIPRTKATSFEEVIANCTERRAGTLKAAPQPTSTIQSFRASSSTLNIPSTDDSVNVLLSIFRDPQLRSTTLFRDLQYIAAFIPTETLDQTVKGKAFWDAGLAALALKEDLSQSMIKRANAITAYHVSSHNPQDPLADQALASTTLRDAANLWLVTAKEGSPIAARELGLFYLTHPELLPRVTIPFSKATDVFKSVSANDSLNSGKERGALDPHTFAVVFHWMEIAANGGDKDARDFLKGNGELNSGR